MGLETVHPVALDRLNKRMTLDGFRRAAEVLRGEGISLCAFVLVQPPFVPEAEALDWAERSVAFAMDCGATAVTLIPTWAGNGALEVLAGHGHFSQPLLSVLERALARSLATGPGRSEQRRTQSNTFTPRVSAGGSFPWVTIPAQRIPGTA